MRCLVTGANGFLGSHLVERLLGEGHQVRVLVRAGADLRWLQGKPLELVEGNLDDEAALLRAAQEVEWAFHVAGVISAHRRETYFAVNVDGSLALAQALRAAAPRLQRMVFVSSQSVTGPGPHDKPLTEQTEPRPVNLYGRSKLAAERALAPLGLPLCVVRPGPIYGPRDRNALALFQLADKGLRLKLGIAETVTNFAYVDDIVSGMMLAASRPEALGRTFLLGGPQNLPFEAVGRILNRAVRGSGSFPIFVPVPLAYAAGAVGGAVSRLRGTAPELNIDRIRMLVQRNWAMDLAEARTHLGFVPRVDLASGASETVRWYRGQGWI